MAYNPINKEILISVITELVSFVKTEIEGRMSWSKICDISEPSDTPSTLSINLSDYSEYKVVFYNNDKTQVLTEHTLPTSVINKEIVTNVCTVIFPTSTTITVPVSSYTSGKIEVYIR